MDGIKKLNPEEHAAVAQVREQIIERLRNTPEIGQEVRIGSIAWHHFGEVSSRSCHIQPTKRCQLLEGTQPDSCLRGGVLGRSVGTTDIITQLS